MKNILQPNFLLLLILALLVAFVTSIPSFATHTPCHPASPYNIRVQNGLISTSKTTNTSVSSDTSPCVAGPKAAFAPYKIPTYDDLKSLYFDQAKTSSDLVKKPLTGDAIHSDIRLDSPSDCNNQNYLYHIRKTDSSSTYGNLTISGNISCTQTGIIFVDGNLIVGPMTENQFTYGSANSGVVFIVKGNVYIHPSVIRVDAVIISSGTIYTAAQSDSTCTSSSVSTYTSGSSTFPVSQLVINGSLISLNPDASSPKIKFCRNLGADNTTLAAEVINQQPKYLVILRDLLSDTYQKWSEIQ